MSSSHARVERRLRGMQLAQILYKCQDKTKDAGEEDSKFTNIYLPCYANAKKAHRETFALFEFFDFAYVFRMKLLIWKLQFELDGSTYNT